MKLATHRRARGGIGYLLILVTAFGGSAQAQPDPSSEPLLGLNNLEYVGAFRLPADTYGSSSLNYSEGPLAYNPSNSSILIVGHAWDQEIAEFVIPTVVNSTTLGDLNMAGDPVQYFTSVLDRAPSGNSQDLNRIGGLAVLDALSGPRLVVNAYEYYDAPGDNTQTTLVVDNPDSIASSSVGGFYTFEGGAGHTSEWISPIPPEWQDSLGGAYITGQSSGIPIISRTSVGPSAFAFNPAYLLDSTTVPTPIPTTKLLDFSLAHPLESDISNTSGTNDRWTHLSRVTYGIILPGTRTYATFGYSGGHGPDGVCYKCTQDDGNLCGGYCAPDADDYYQYAWFWDVNDLMAVKKGTMNSYDVEPYWYGAFPTPFENGTHEIGGGAYDPVTGYIYLTIQKGDREQGTYANPPVVVVYRVANSVTADLKVMLQGPYQPESDDMSTGINADLPLTQPYDSTQYDGTVLDYDGTESVASMPADVVDWCLVQLRTGDPSSPPMTIVATRAALLVSDGSIVDTDGGPVTFAGVSPGDYYLVVMHRNHLGVMSASPVALSDASAPYDFTTSASQAFGLSAMKELEPGVWGLFAADANADGLVTALDFGAWLAGTTAGLTGYQPADFDLDGAVTATDFVLWLANTTAGAASRVPE
ncbi:MAG: hypothetical protein WBW88_05200 [Rhodothermales bacterium]